MSPMHFGASLWSMPIFLLHHRHAAHECGPSFAAWKGFDSPLRHGVAPSTCLAGGHAVWWRVEAAGVRNVPAHGRALLVANHAGILPWDATMMGVAMLREHPLPRYPRFLVLNWAFELPYVGSTIRSSSTAPTFEW